MMNTLMAESEPAFFFMEVVFTTLDIYVQEDINKINANVSLAIVLLHGAVGSLRSRSLSE